MSISHLTRSVLAVVAVLTLVLSGCGGDDDSLSTTTVNLDEDGTHIELEGLAAPLEYNSAFHVTLSFESAPDQRVEGAVRDPADPES